MHFKAQNKNLHNLKIPSCQLHIFLKEVINSIGLLWKNRIAQYYMFEIIYDNAVCLCHVIISSQYMFYSQ